MDYCHYHPRLIGTYRCDHCDKALCDSCIDDNPKLSHPRCFVCAHELTSLGHGHSVEPFWRKLEQIFRYPLKKDALIAIVGLALISAALSAFNIFGVIFTLIFILIINGIFVKYSFSCLKATAEGEMEAPDVSSAYSGGVVIMLKLLGIIVIYSLAIGFVGHYSPPLAGLLSLCLLLAFPAILIRFAQTESLRDALNPLNHLQLILAIGLPYGLLLAFIMIMIGSLGVISAIIGSSIPGIAVLLQSIAGNYYVIATFHLMGYMIFQYQDRLGFSARIGGPHGEARDAKARCLSKVDVLIKEGEYQSALDVFRSATTTFVDDKEIYQSYFELLLNSKNKSELEKFASAYLKTLLNLNRYDLLNVEFKRTCTLLPKFIPNDPELRFVLAQLAKDKGHFSLAIRLLFNLHKSHAHYLKLQQAYELLAQCFDCVAGMEKQAQQCRSWLVQRRNNQSLVGQSEAGSKMNVKESTGAGEGPADKKSEQTRELAPIEFKRE